MTSPNEEEDEKSNQIESNSPTNSNRRHTHSSSNKLIKEEDLPLEQIKETDEDDNQSVQHLPHNLTRDQDIAVVGATKLSDMTLSNSNISSFKNSPIRVNSNRPKN